MTDLIAGSLIILGGIFALIGALGLLRMPDVLIRMHASTKIGTLSTGLILAGSAVFFGTSDIIIRVVAVVLFLLLTAPIGAHMMGRSVLSTGVPLWRNEDVQADKVEDLLLREHDPVQDKQAPEN
jgi:multicomponent Na+:H+ antiporter subunit G